MGALDDGEGVKARAFVMEWPHPPTAASDLSAVRSPSYAAKRNESSMRFSARMLKLFVIVALKSRV